MMGKTGRITDKPSQHQGNFVRGKRSTGHEPMLDQPELPGAQISDDITGGLNGPTLTGLFLLQTFVQTGSD
jgi:hypothetical protein